MKIQKVPFLALKQYHHPGAKLFRSIELLAAYELVKDVRFAKPSLDLGCGDGYISSLLFDQQFSYGLDNNEAGDVKIAQEKKRYGKFLLEWAENMSLKDETLSFVFSNSVIEHIPPQDDVLKEVHRVLKKGGKFLFTTPSDNFRKYLYVSALFNKIGLTPLANWYSIKRNQQLNHYHLYSINEWKKRLKKFGFKLERYSYCVAKETLELWDKMAWEVVLRKPFDAKSEDTVYQKYKNEIQLHIKKTVTDEEGADLVILATRN